MSEEVDRGMIVKTKEINILSNDTAFSLWTRSVDSAVKLLADFFEMLGELQKIPEGVPVKDGGKYYSKNIASFKKVPEPSNPEMIEKWARAFCFPPHEPAYIEVNNEKVYVLPCSWIYK